MFVAQVNEDFNIDYDYMKQEIQDLDLNDELKADLMEGIDICNDFTVSGMDKQWKSSWK